MTESRGAETDGFAVEPWEDGCAFSVKAHAGARRDAFAGFHDGMLKVETTAAPEKGKANKAIRKMLAGVLSVPASSVIVLSGETNTKKRIGVKGVPAREALARLAPREH